MGPKVFGAYRGAVLVATLAALAGEARAQLPQPFLDRVFPLGGQAGSEVELEITGRDLDDARTLYFDHAGLRAELVKPNQFRVKIAASVPPGTYEVRAVGKYGISGAKLFAVSRGLAEVREVEPNDTPDKAQTVPGNCAINGQSDSNGSDCFRFPARQGEHITLDCQAFRLDSPLRAVLTVLTADGKELAQARPAPGHPDPTLTFTAPADGAYIVCLRDLTFTGDLPYRLVLSNRPYVNHVFPPVVPPGIATQVTVFGHNLPGGKPTPAQDASGQPLEQLVLPFQAPRDAAACPRFAFLNHPDAPALEVRGLQVWPPALPGGLNPLTLAWATAPVVLEREPNDTPGTAQPLTLPAVVCGRFDRPGDADWYTFTAKAGTPIALDLLCERIGSWGDPFVVVTDAAGKDLETFDDHGNNANALIQLNRDPLGVYTIPADGTYRLLVQERTHKGGPGYQYALRVGRPEPDFCPVVCHETANDPSCPVVHRGGAAFYEVTVNRRDGFSGPVTVEAEGLPPGLACPPVHISAQAETANVVFRAAANAPEWAGAVRLKAWAVVNGQRIEREVQAAQRRFGNGFPLNVCRAGRQICLAIRGNAPYALEAAPGVPRVAVGGTLETKLRLERRWPDFRDRVQVSGLNLPPGFDIPLAEAPADQKEIPIKITVSGDVPPGTYSLVLRGDAQVPFSPDPKAKDKPKVRVADPSTPLTVEVTAPRK